MKKLLIGLEVGLLIFVISCMQVVKEQKPVFKYILQQKCSPNVWTGIPIDTSTDYKRVAESY
ncbi:MAG: hypothetical protein ACK4SO_06945, partial [Candidatus Kapaibacteriota bacterium]